MNIENLIKNSATAIAVIVSILYGSGYLALRSRAYALGTDPAFSLIDEGYVFAGFRFILSTLFIVLLLIPAFLVFKWGLGLLTTTMSPRILHISQWVALVLLAMVTIASLKILSVKGVLLFVPNQDNTYSALQDVVLGNRQTLRSFLMILPVFITGLTLLWLKEVSMINRLSLMNSILGIIAIMQLFIAPIYHGALFADRYVRIPQTIPAQLNTIEMPVGIVERTRDHAVLYGNKNGSRVISTIKIEDLNGIAIKEIVPLDTFINNHLSIHHNAEERIKPVLMARNESNKVTTDKKVKDTKKTRKNTTVFSSILAYLNMTLEGIGSLSDGTYDSGQLWQAELDDSGNVVSRKRLGMIEDLSWPVLGCNNSIYAIQKDKIVKLDKEGNLINSDSNSYTWVKLLGVDQESRLAGIIQNGDDLWPASLLAQTGEVQLDDSPLSGKEKEILLIMMQEARSYIDNRKLFVERSERGRKGFDIFLAHGDKVVNISDSGNDRCRQPFLSHDSHIVLFIKIPKY